jgi:hypothetical protein
MRKLALALPEVEEKSHFGKPDFRVRNKIFAGLSQDGSEGNLKLAPELQAMLLSSKPAAFSPAAGAWGRSGWTMIQLAHVASGELAELLREAHALVAPKSVASFRSGAGPRPSTFRSGADPRPSTPARKPKQKPAKKASKASRSTRTR